MAGADYAVRIAGDTVTGPDLEVEAELLRRLAARLPVPKPVVVSSTETTLAGPYLIYPWIEGITLNECRRSHGRGAIATLAHSLGRITATIATTRDLDTLPLPHVTVGNALDEMDVLLEASRARDRLGPDVADALRAELRRWDASLRQLDATTGLVHHDFSGRNVIVRETDDGTWDVTGILDWETPSVGSSAWDLGSLFRYGQRYDEDFRARFETGYRAGGGTLPDEWWRLSRLLDATRLVGILSGDRDLPTVFDDCRSIIGQLI
jgi:aminoglycoside phosphotransferase (APT) family kinase protein